MASPEIIPILESHVRNLRVLASTAAYPDEISLKVDADSFKETALALHKLLSSPVMMLFAADERSRQGVFKLRCVFLNAKQNQWVILETDLSPTRPSFDSLAVSMHSAILFEREIWEMFGLIPQNHPDLRRLHLHNEVWPKGNHPMLKDFKKTEGALEEYKFIRVEGTGIFEVPVGPVHAGIIGPGHFRFSLAGEPIINLESRLGFTHRGVEKLLEGNTPKDALKIIECISGDSIMAYSLAFTKAIEKISHVEASADVNLKRTIFLELERMASHIHAIGGIALDVGFSFPSAYASLIKEMLLTLNIEITGSRYLKNTNTIGGTEPDFNDKKIKLLKETLDKVKADFKELVKILNSSVSFMDRVDTTGVLRRKTAEDLGIIGLAGRASGIPMDIRKYFSILHNEAKFKLFTRDTGDVLARLTIRILEFDESCRLIEDWIPRLTLASAPVTQIIEQEGNALGYAEGARGPVLMWVQTDAQGIITRCKIVDPSFHNWPGLSFAVLGNILPDFPLCNKSFDLSYSGNDL